MIGRAEIEGPSLRGGLDDFVADVATISGDQSCFSDGAERLLGNDLGRVSGSDAGCVGGPIVALDRPARSRSHANLFDVLPKFRKISLAVAYSE